MQCSKSALSDERSFTLVEVLVVIGLIGILSAIVVMAINPIQFLKQSRDSARIEAVKQLQNSLQYYYTEKGVYPLPGQYSTATYRYEYLKSTWEAEGFPTVENELIAGGYLGGSFAKKPMAGSAWWYVASPYWQYLVFTDDTAVPGCRANLNYRILIELESWSQDEIGRLPFNDYGCNFRHSCYWDATYSIAYCYLFNGQSIPLKSELP